jgi:tetratricopeptide (TPR) repeat protein
MHKSYQAWSLQQQAEQCNDLGRYDHAVELAKQALAIDPNFAHGYGSLCRAYIGLKQFKKAEKAVRRALELQSENEWFLRMLSISLRFQNRFRRAIAPAQECVRIAPMSAEAHIELAACLVECRRFAKAHQHLDKALELAPTDPAAHFAKGYLLLRQKHWQLAEREFRSALRLDPMDPLTLNNLGVCLNNQKKYQDAALAFKSAVLLDPNMKLAKQNTLQTVNLIKSATPVKTALVILGMILFASAQLLRNGTRDFEDSESIAFVKGVFVTVLAFAIIFLGVIHYWYGRRIRKQIESEDPELHELYERIKKFG